MSAADWAALLPRLDVRAMWLYPFLKLAWQCLPELDRRVLLLRVTRITDNAGWLLPGTIGTTTGDGDGGVMIVLDPRMRDREDEGAILSLILHEFAHALANDPYLRDAGPACEADAHAQVDVWLSRARV